MAVECLDRIEGIVEDAQEDLHSVWCHRNTIEFLYQQMVKMKRMCQYATNVHRKVKADSAEKDIKSTTQFDEGDSGELGSCLPEEPFLKVKNEMKRAGLVLKQTAELAHLRNIQKVSTMRAKVEKICKKFEQHAKILIGDKGVDQYFETIETTVDERHVAADRKYMFHFLDCIITRREQNEKLGESSDDFNKVRGRWEALTRDLGIKESLIPWVPDADLDTMIDERIIGSGGCGTVHSFHWKTSKVAVKKFVDKYGYQLGNEAQAALFTDIEMQQSISDPRVVHILAASKSGTVVMELADRNLSDLMNMNLSWAAKGRMLLEAAFALKAVHDQGLIHTGVKGPNFLLFGDDLKTCA